MKRKVRAVWCVVLCATTVFTGCQPVQPHFLGEDGDLSHYLDVSTTIDYPDVEHPTLDEVTGAQAPLSLRNSENYEMWDLSLEEATRMTLCNSQVMRQLGGAVRSTAPANLTRSLVTEGRVTTAYDPALVESGAGVSHGSEFDGLGVESALAAFDAQLTTSVIWQQNDRPVNFQGGNFGNFFATNFQQDVGNFNAGIQKTNAEGGTVGFTNRTEYDKNNNGNRAAPSDWETNFEMFFTQPLFQGRGAQYNRIAGPLSFDQYAGGAPNAMDGVVIARIRTDLSLADFEGGVRNMMRDVEQAYWELYFTYRDLEARKLGRDSALATWKKVAALYRVGGEGGSADREAQAKAQYYQFRAQVEQALTDLYRAESRLRYIMGLSVSDGRLIRPADEPTTARVDFDWAASHSESLVRRVEIRKQKWQIKRRELELIAARNHLLPRIDALGRYRFVGAGDELIDNTGVPPFGEGSSAFETLTDGNYQEWEIGVQAAIPIGFRRQLDGVRFAQLLLARERALMQDLELEVSHQLGEAVRDLDLQYGLTESNFNRRVAAEREVAAVEEAYKADRVTLDLVLDAQRRRAEAESAYYRSLVDYNLSIINVHFNKGSLLDYNGVQLAEGPWPGKAYFDALRRARQRDASLFMDYGFTRPNVFSRGPVEQGIPTGTGVPAMDMPMGAPTPAEMLPYDASGYESVPSPTPAPTADMGAWQMPAAAPANYIGGNPGRPVGAAGLAYNAETAPYVTPVAYQNEAGPAPAPNPAAPASW